MRVTTVDINASNSNKVMTLSFKDPYSRNPYIATGVIGLDAEEITPKFYGLSALNDRFYDLSMKKRDITLQVSLNPNFSLGKTYSMLRDDLFRLISSSRTGKIQIIFKDGVDSVASISGFVTKLESSQFTNSPGVNLTISCDDPMLKALIRTEEYVGHLDPQNTTINDAESTAPHGVQMGFSFTATTTFFIIEEGPVPEWQFLVNMIGSTYSPFVAGDKLQLSSEYNDKYVKLIRGSSVYHLADRLATYSMWPLLFPGENKFVCSVGVSWDYIKYYKTYWGI